MHENQEESPLVKKINLSVHKKDAERAVELVVNLYDQLETANGFFFLGDRLNASGGCETGVGCIKFKECE